MNDDERGNKTIPTKVKYKIGLFAQERDKFGKHVKYVINLG